MVRSTFSPARAWRPAVVARLARTLGGITHIMRIHRLTESRYADRMLEGQLRFGRARYYQMQEAVFADESIGDKLECVFHAIVNAEIDTSQGVTSTQQNLAAMGFLNISGNSRVTISNSQIYRELDCYLSCWTTVDNPTLDGVGSTYDCRVTAKGAKTLRHLLWARGTVQPDGLPVPSQFRSLASGRVYYEPMEYDVAETTLPSPNPFRKRLKYRNQSEYRLVLFPTASLGLDFITVNCPEAASLLSIAHLPKPTQATAELSRTEVGDFSNSLDSIVRDSMNLQKELDRRYDQQLDQIRLLPHSSVAMQTYKAVNEAKLSEQRQLEHDFDRRHLQTLRRRLFEARREPHDERLDKAIAREQGSSRLIQIYTMSQAFR